MQFYCLDLKGHGLYLAFSIAVLIINPLGNLKKNPKTMNQKGKEIESIAMRKDLIPE